MAASVLPPPGTVLTAAQAAAQGLSSYAPGTSDPSGLFANTGSMATVPPGMPAGWYQLPGSQTAEWVDPSTGAVPKDVATGTITSGNLINGDPATVASQDYYQSPQFMNAEQNAISLEKTGLTPQQAQDQILGTGPDQKGVMNASGQNQNMDSIYELEGQQNGETAAAEAQSQGAVYGGGQTGVQAKAGDPGYRDVSTINSSLLPPIPPPPPGLTGYNAANQPGVEPYLAAKEANVNSAAGQLNDTNAAIQEGIAEKNLAASGNINGISQNLTDQQTALYNSIQTDDEKNEWLVGQDPGNLTPALRSSREAALAKTNAIYNPSVNDKATAVPGGLFSQITGTNVPDGTEGNFSVTYGDISQTDPVTGRTIIYGEQPKAAQYTAPKASEGGFGFMGNLANTGFGEGMARTYMGAVGGLSGFAMSGGNLLAAGVGAYEGAGGWMPSNGFGGGSWKARGINQLQGPSGQSLALSGLLSGGLGAAKNVYNGLPAFGQGMPIGTPIGGAGGTWSPYSS